ncbi:putative malate dehydrogenase 1B [Vespa velutina]|uniref:putative malate dehydrogenase 1B n=1 Tax=Vespa velutina TaxID=202808 RepID=UPI001FB4EE25|nr:putative malate dehydrogenase 1B [Vespa velutina]
MTACNINIEKNMSADKCVIIIAGIPDDVYFCHICYIAENLAKILSNFKYNKIFKSALEWKSWLEKICYRWNWSHTKSPLIWKKVGLSKNNVTYIGGVNQFWEFLHLHYNISDYITEDDLKKLQLDYSLVKKIFNYNNDSVIILNVITDV